MGCNLTPDDADAKVPTRIERLGITNQLEGTEVIGAAPRGPTIAQGVTAASAVLLDQASARDLGAFTSVHWEASTRASWR
jgi:hypothetical protein